MSRIRNHAVTVRFSEKEFEEFQEKLSKSNYTQAAFILDAVRGIPIQPPQLSEEIRELAENLNSMDRQLRGMANNINQLTRLANQNQDVPGMAYLKEIKKQVVEMRKELRDTWQFLKLLIQKEHRMQQ